MCKCIIEKRVALNNSYKRKKGLKKGIKTYNMYWGTNKKITYELSWSKGN